MDLCDVSLSRTILDCKIPKRREVYALAVSFYNIVNHLFTGTTDLLNTQILTLLVTRHEEMLAKQIQDRCECVQECVKRCRRMNVFPKVQVIYTFPDNGVNTLITIL